MTKMNWDRVRRENRQIRYGLDHPGPKQIDFEPKSRYVPNRSRKKTSMIDKAIVPKKAVKSASVRSGLSKRQEVMKSLRQITTLASSDLANWSPEDLRTARDLCHAGALRFNESLKHKNRKQKK